MKYIRIVAVVWCRNKCLKTVIRLLPPAIVVAEKVMFSPACVNISVQRVGEGGGAGGCVAGGGGVGAGDGH